MSINHIFVIRNGPLYNFMMLVNVEINRISSFKSYTRSFIGQLKDHTTPGQLFNQKTCLLVRGLQMLRRSPRLLIQAIEINKGSSSKTLSSLKNEVVHDPDNSMFYVQIGNDKAYLQYDRFNHVLDLFETEVPKAFRGKGVAQILAKAAFDHVVKNNLKMKVTCTYLQSYLSKNPAPEYVSRVVD